MKTRFFKIFILFVSFSTLGQADKKAQKGVLYPDKIGVLFNYGDEKNFIFDDLDYYYTNLTLKGQLFYELGNWKKFDFELIVQPQIQFLQHQLLNPFFVREEDPNYQEKREEFTQLKTMQLYALEFGFSIKKEIATKLYLQATAALGFAIIDTRTERLTKGFTFIENFSLGFSYQTTTKTFLSLGTNFGHVSNLNFQKPNDGYNILGLEIGFSYLLK
jgi:hypothetical protein